MSRFLTYIPLSLQHLWSTLLSWVINAVGEDSSGNQAYLYPFGFFTVSIFHFLDLEHQLLSSPPAVVNDSFLPAFSVASFLFRFYPTQLKYTFNPHYRLFLCPFQFIWLVRYCCAHFNLCSFLRYSFCPSFLPDSWPDKWPNIFIC